MSDTDREPTPSTVAVSAQAPVLSSVVLLRLRDFARRPVAEQARLSAQLEAVLAVLLPDISPAQRIVLQGNGLAAVAVLDNAPAALVLAERAMRANQADLGLGIGIDHGPVELLDGEGVPFIGGDGVSTAALAATFAKDHGLLVTASFRRALLQAEPGARGALVAAGSFSDAGLRNYDLFRHDPGAAARRRRRLWAVGAGVLVAMALVATAARLWWPERPRPLAPLVEDAREQVKSRVQKVFHGQP